MICRNSCRNLPEMVAENSSLFSREHVTHSQNGVLEQKLFYKPVIKTSVYKIEETTKEKRMHSIPLAARNRIVSKINVEYFAIIILLN